MGNRKSREYTDKEKSTTDQPILDIDRHKSIFMPPPPAVVEEVDAAVQVDSESSEMAVMPKSQPVKLNLLPPEDGNKKKHKLSMADFGGSLNSVLNRPQSSRKYSQTQDQTQLSDQEKIFLRESWHASISNRPEFIMDVWMAASDRSPTIKSTFVQYASNASRDQNNDHSKSDARLRDLTKSIHEFLHKLIVMEKLDTPIMRRSCEALGLRHRSYTNHGFQPVFFDIFIKCFLENLEIVYKSSHPETQHGIFRHSQKQDQLIGAWKKFLSIVVDMMRDGYLKSDHPFSAISANPSTLHLNSIEQ